MANVNYGPWLRIQNHCHSNLVWSGGSLNHYASKLAAAAMHLGLLPPHVHFLRQVYKVTVIHFAFIQRSPFLTIEGERSLHKYFIIHEGAEAHSIKKHQVLFKYLQPHTRSHTDTHAHMVEETENHHLFLFKHLQIKSYLTCWPLFTLIPLC